MPIMLLLYLITIAVLCKLCQHQMLVLNQKLTSDQQRKTNILCDVQDTVLTKEGNALTVFDLCHPEALRYLGLIFL